MNADHMIYAQIKRFDELYNVDIEDSCFGTRTVSMGSGFTSYCCDIDDPVQLLKEDIMKTENSRSEHELNGLKFLLKTFLTCIMFPLVFIRIY
jgi:hypothetical protein